MRDAGLHIDDAQLVFDGGKADASERDGRCSVTGREILVNQPRARAIELNEHRARAAIPRERHFDGALMLQRELILLAGVPLQVARAWIIRERSDGSGNYLLGWYEAGGNVGADGVCRRRCRSCRRSARWL